MTDDAPRRARPRRRLSDSERTLWREVTRGIAPMRPAAAAEQPLPAEPEPVPPQPAAGTPPRAERAAQIPPSAPSQPPLAPLGRRLRQRIARGSHAIGGRLDLHGLTQREAHDALLGFLRTAQARGDGLVLVITGKGAPAAESGHERGVLKRQVPLWLRLPAFRELVVGFEPAHVTHGGEGALYVRVRRRRDL